MTRLARIATFSVLLGPLGAIAMADDNRSGSTPMFRPADQLIGMDVRNKENESMGHIEDFVVNKDDGKIVYVAMARDQVLGFGGNLYAVGPEALTLSQDGEHFMLEAQPGDFERLRGFDQNAWPTRPDRRWTKSGVQTSTDRDGTVQTNSDLCRVNALRNLNVYSRTATDTGQSLGPVYDVAIDWKEHRIAYAAIHYGGTLGVGGKLVAVPWTAFDMKTPPDQRSGRALFINATVEDFDRAVGFTSDNWPNQPSECFRNLGRK